MRNLYFSWLIAGLIFGAASGTAATSDTENPLFQSPLIAEPLVLDHQSEFSQPVVRWRVEFRLNSLQSKQTLVSYDEMGQATAGHTTITVSKRGYVEIRHQDGGTSSFTTRSKTRIQPGKDYDLDLLIRKNEQLTLSLNGRVEADSTQAFGTDETIRKLVLGASCAHCKPGSTAPLRYPIDGVMTFSILADSSAPIDPEPPVPPPTDPEPPAPPPPDQSTILFQSPTLSTTTVEKHQSAFSQQEAKWRVHFRVNNVGLAQGLFSYDETYQDTAGHTTLEVIPDGRLQLRHQDGTNQSIKLLSTTKIKPATHYEAVVVIAKNKLLALDVNGVREDQANSGFGTDETRRDLVLGATCAYCKKGTTSPLRQPIDGTVSLTIETITDDDLTGSTPPQPEPPPVTDPEPPAPPTDPEPPAAPSPTLDFSASESEVFAGGQVDLNWQSTNAHTCTASGAWAGQQSLGGSATVQPQQGASTYTLTCEGDEGTVVNMVAVSVISSVRVNWTRPTKNTDGSTITDLKGFVVHYGTSSNNYANQVSVNDPSATSTEITMPAGTFYFAVTAVNFSGRTSSYSSEVQATVR